MDAVTYVECDRCGFSFPIAVRRWRLCGECRTVDAKNRQRLDTSSPGYRLALSATRSRLAVEIAASALRPALDCGDLLRIRQAALVALHALDEADAPSRSLRYRQGPNAGLIPQQRQP